MLPDRPSVHTLQALGISEKKAETKARLDFNRYRNMINKVLPDIVDNANDIELIQWNTLEKEKSYQDALNELQILYDTNTPFRSDVEEECVRMLRNNKANTYDALGEAERRQRIGHAVQFLLMELACVLSAPKTLQKEKVLYLYHRPMVVMQKLLEGAYDGKTRDNVGSFVYREFTEE